MATFDYSVTRDRKVYKAFLPIARFLAKIVYRIEFEGLENFPQEGGYILASNHVVAVDPVMLATRVPHPVHFMGKIEAFRNPFGRWFLTHFNSFPVERGKGDMQSIDYAAKLIAEKKVVGIFPEGTRSKDLKLGRPKSGVAYIAKLTHADVMPVSIRFEDKPKFRAKVVIRFGKLIPYEDLGLETDDLGAVRKAAKTVMGQIAELWEGSRFDD